MHGGMKHRVLQPLLLCLVAVASHNVAAGELTQPLTTEEVTCNERQLERLLGRLAAGDEVLFGLQLAKTLLVSYSNSVGFYDGLAMTAQQWRLDLGDVPPFPTPPEHYLGFHINPSVRALLLNPGRTPLGQVALEREETGSNLVGPGGSLGVFDLKVRLDPNLPDNPRPEPLVINNFVVPAAGSPYNGFRAASTKPGRGLSQDGLLTPCHAKFTDFDRHVFALLQRMLRGRGEPVNRIFAGDVEISVFRGEARNLYRANVYVLGGASAPYEARLAIELELGWTPEGRITSGTMRARPLCASGEELGCSQVAQLPPVAFLIRPVFGGHEHWHPDLDDVGVSLDEASQPTPPVSLDFEALLSGTAWNPPAP